MRLRGTKRIFNIGFYICPGWTNVKEVNLDVLRLGIIKYKVYLSVMAYNI